MPRTTKIKIIDIEKNIMSKVTLNQITMKPHWYFVIGSIAMIIGFVGLSIGAIFLTNLTLFLLRQHGPMGQVRLEQMLGSFSWWVPILAVIGIVLGIWLLKKYDFSYKKNFPLIVIGFITTIILTATIMNYFGLNEFWSRQGPMRRFYQQIENQNSTFPRGQGRGRLQNQQ